MSKAILTSINPESCKLIVSGEKTFDIRKLKPQLELPFKCYIYCTLSRKLNHDNEHVIKSPIYIKNGILKYDSDDIDSWELGNGKIIGEYICDRIETLFNTDDSSQYKNNVLLTEFLKNTSTTFEEFQYYVGTRTGKKSIVHGWHISNLKIYDKPKEFDYFRKPVDCHRGKDHYDCVGCWDCEIKRPPQSWCYIEGSSD